jgi:hypothetical protein
MPTQHERPAGEARREFEQLDAIRIAVEERLAGAVASLTCYADAQSGGFFHQLTKQTHGEPSRASTATCAAFLVASGRWAEQGTRWNGKANSLAATLASQEWSSAGLPEGNPFTVSFLLEAHYDLREAARQESAAGASPARPAEPLAPGDGTSPDAAPELDGQPRVGATTQDDPGQAVTSVGPEQTPATVTEIEKGAASSAAASVQAQIDQRLNDLAKQLVDAKGGLSIEAFPATSFLTYNAVRTLDRGQALTDEARTAARAFGWSRLYQESVRVSAGASGADVFELAYAVLTVSATTPLSQMTAPERDALRYALGQFFAAQDAHGLWPRSRQLFRYPELGNAYCYDYELLVKLLSDRQLAPLLKDKLEPLTRTFDALEPTAIPIGGEGEVGWASGHLNPNNASPESWTTASVYHFCHEFRRFVVDAIREAVFAYTRTAMPRASLDGNGGVPTIDPNDLLDSDVIVDDSGNTVGLRGLLERELLGPILADRDRVQRGHGLRRKVPNSAILYGPPGTSKTQLAEIVGRSLGWPLLKLDPSHLTRDGLDRLHAETNLLFTMLASAERVVVLLDEFDELVLDRDQTGAESSSRFLTTAMLPKIAELASRRRIVYLLATNHIERFDDAISRAGRFDLVVPVMPPTLTEKLRRWPDVKAKIDDLYGSGAHEGLDAEHSDVLGDLTYLEFEHFANEVEDVSARNDFSDLVRRFGRTATLLKPLGTGEGDAPITWKTRVLRERGRNRLHHA